MKDIVIIGTENIGQEVVKIIEAINSKEILGIYWDL